MKSVLRPYIFVYPGYANILTVPSCFVDDRCLGCVKDDVASSFDEGACCKESIWHVVKYSHRRCCVRDIERDPASFLLGDFVAIGDHDVKSIGDRGAIEDARLPAGKVTGGPTVKLPWFGVVSIIIHGLYRLCICLLGCQ